MIANRTKKTDAEFDKDLAQFMKESDRVIQLTKESGLHIEMDHWLTIKRYAEKYGVTTQLISHWITRGVIPADCVEELPELNNLRLVKDQPYR